MQIAYVSETYPPEINGVSLTVARTVAYLRGRGHDVDLIRPCQVGETRGGDRSEWRSAGYPIPVYPDLRFGVSLPSTLAARFERSGAELVHVATEGPLGWAAVAAAANLGVASTSDFRTNFHRYSAYYGVGWLEPLIGSYLRRFHNRTGRCFSPTRETRRALIASGFERVRVVGRGVDTGRFDPARRSDSLRASWGARSGPVLLTVGRLAPEKNVALALRAFRAVRQLDSTARMVVVGDGPARARLQRDFPEAFFAGTQTGDALAEHYASADFFLFPSLSETFGNVTLEAMASGLPVVAFDVAAALEHVVDHVSGRTVPAGDDAAFMRATCALAADFQALGPMGMAARAAAAALDWDSVLAVFEGELLDTVRSHESTRTAAACPA